jgi:hypothetical protein
MLQLFFPVTKHAGTNFKICTVSSLITCVGHSLGFSASQEHFPNSEEPFSSLVLRTVPYLTPFSETIIF